VVVLEPCRLDPLASINRVRLDGREARELLSAPGLRALARARGLEPAGPLRSFLDADPGGPAVAAEFGGRLGRLLALLRSGERSARPEWGPSWWERWAAADTVWLGGGLAGGPFGRAVAARAAEVAGGRVEVAPDAEDLPLVGAARLAGGPGAAAGTRVVLDFGHTWVKRALVRGGELTRLNPVPAPPEDATGPEVAAAVAAALSEAWTGAGRPPGPVVAAMAAYVVDGQPVRTPLGTYARLADVTPDVPRRLAARVGVPVELVHDGTAAAHAVPPDPRSVVVLLGTSLGVGFPHRCTR
jgi:hypothetical protein